MKVMNKKEKDHSFSFFICNLKTQFVLPNWVW
jgi:hypothetical protein